LIAARTSGPETIFFLGVHGRGGRPANLASW
jgi:hypothetical protein